MTWISIVQSVALMTCLVAYLGMQIKDKDLEGVKGFMFLFAVVNAFMLGLIPLAITLNPHNPESFYPVAVGYLSVCALSFIAFIYYYGFNHLVMKILKK
jgi:F0F1-type ATP synthase assembly protein I